MSEVKPGGVEIAVNVNDLSQEGINSAKQNLKSLEKTAEGTAEKLAPLKDELSSKLDTMNGLNGLVAMQGGFNSLFSSATRAGTALKKTRESIEDLSAETKGGLGNVLNFVGGLTSVLQTQFSVTNRLGQAHNNLNSVIANSKTVYENYINQQQAAKQESAAMYQNKDRLIELVKMRKKNSEQIAESIKLVEQMNATYKGLNLTVDANNGKIGNIKDLKNRIDTYHKLNNAKANTEIHVGKINQLNSIARSFGLQSVSVTDRQAAATLLLSNAEAGATLKRKILSAETYKGIAANIQSVFWKKSATVATQGQARTNLFCAATNVVLGVTAKGASTAFLTLKASMATNPLGWILLAVEGVTLLGAEIYKLVKSLWEVPSAAERAAESMEKLNKASAASYEANQRRLERLVQLNDQGGAKTDAQKQEAREIIQTLNAYHDLGLKLDENTGKINVNAASLEKHQEKMRRHRREVLAGTIKANEELLDQRYKELSKKLAGSYSTYDQAKGEAKIRIQIELDKEGDAQIAELKENLEKLREERQKLLNDSDKARREAQERLKQRRQEESKKHEEAFSFMGREWVTMQRAGMSEEEQEIARVKGAYNEQRKEIEKIVKEKKKRLESTAHELATLAALNRSEQQRIEFIRQQYAAKRAEEARKENEKDRQLVEKLTEDRNSKNRTELENEVHQLQKSIAERKERLQKLVDEGKATEEQKQTLQELIELERQRTEQIKQQHAERLKAQIQQFDGNQLNRTRRQQEAAEDRKTRKDIERNPFKAGLNLKAQREEIEAKIEEAKRKVEQAHAFALKQGDLTDKQKAIVEQREKNLLDLQQQQDRLQGLMGEAENEARNRVASLLQQYASEKTPSVLDTKFKGTVEAYKAEIENQQRGQMDGKDVKLENIKTILERDEQRKQQNEQKIIEIGRQIVANLQGV